MEEILPLEEPKESGFCLEHAALAVLGVGAVDRRIAQAAYKGQFTEWRRTPRHVSPLRRPRSLSPRDRASG